MGRFVNPGSSAFQAALNSEIYVDKTGLIEYTNRVLGTTDAYICDSRPRRFGKSYAANMLAAYYSKGASAEELLNATLDMDGAAVAEQIETIHNAYASAIQYNNENSLSSVLAITYLSAMQYYFKPVRESSTGRGFADFVFIPMPECRMDYPALLVELKWNKNTKTAIDQIPHQNLDRSPIS